MAKLWEGLLLLIIAVSVSTKEEDLPLCPTNVQFFPQTLPMHCRMPANAMLPGLQPMSDVKTLPAAPPIPPPFFQSPPPNQQGNPMTIIGPPGMPGPMLFGGPGPMSIMPMHPPVPTHKLPVIVMPFYKPDPAFKKSSEQKRNKKKHNKHRRPQYDSIYDTDTSTDTDYSSDTSSDSSTDVEWWRKRTVRNRNTRKFNKKYKSKKIKRKRNENKELLTPLLQYVTKDGYVIYEKKISKGEAQDWLDVKNEDEINNSKRLDKHPADLNLSVRREIKAVNVKPIVSVEEKPKFIQKPHSKRKRNRSNNNEQIKST